MIPVTLLIEEIHLWSILIGRVPILLWVDFSHSKWIPGCANAHLSLKIPVFQPLSFTSSLLHVWSLLSSFISCGGVLSFNLDQVKRGSKAKVLRSILVPESWWSHRELRTWAALRTLAHAWCNVLFAAPHQRAQTGCLVGRSVLEGSLQHHKFRTSLSLAKWVRGKRIWIQRTFLRCVMITNRSKAMLSSVGKCGHGSVCWVW